MPIRTVGSKRVSLRPASGWQQAHDCNYIKRRNACIAEAERSAEEAVREAQARDRREGRAAAQHEDLFTTVFLQAMDRLSKKAEARARRRVRRTEALSRPSALNVRGLGESA
jgi:hypothetical protein